MCITTLQEPIKSYYTFIGSCLLIFCVRLTPSPQVRYTCICQVYVHLVIHEYTICIHMLLLFIIIIVFSGSHNFSVCNFYGYIYICILPMNILRKLHHTHDKSPIIYRRRNKTLYKYSFVIFNNQCCHHYCADVMLVIYNGTIHQTKRDCCSELPPILLHRYAMLRTMSTEGR